MDISLSNNLGNSLILQSLPKSFAQFIMNFNMQEMTPSYADPHNMLKTTDEDMHKGGSALLIHGASSLTSRASEKSKGKKKRKVRHKLKKMGPQR